MSHTELLLRFVTGRFSLSLSLTEMGLNVPTLMCQNSADIRVVRLAFLEIFLTGAAFFCYYFFSYRSAHLTCLLRSSCDPSSSVDTETFHPSPHLHLRAQ
jgi:hypothetical protein